MTGGIAAFWGAKVLGPRIGKYGPDGKPRAILGHNVPFAILGCFILLVGWYGFNPGSELAADAAIGGIAVTTTLAGAAGALAAMATVWIRTGKPDVGMTGNGLLAGLVGITAGCAAVTGPYAVLHRRPRRRPRRVRRRRSSTRWSRSTTRSAPSRSTACAVRSARCAWACSPARTSTGFWKQGLLLGGGPDQLGQPDHRHRGRSLAWVSVTLAHPLHRAQGHHRPAGRPRRRS